MSSLLLSHLPVISCYTCYVWSAILNTVSLHPTVVDYCTVRYGTGVVRASVCTPLNSMNYYVISQNSLNIFISFLYQKERYLYFETVFHLFQNKQIYYLPFKAVSPQLSIKLFKQVFFVVFNLFNPLVTVTFYSFVHKFSKELYFEIVFSLLQI